MVRPVISIVLLLQLIWDLRVFTQITMLQDAGARRQRDRPARHLHLQARPGAGDFGMASAVAIFVLVLTIAISWYYIRACSRRTES